MTAPSQSPFYIRLVGQQVEKPVAQAWASLVKSNLPNGVMNAIQSQSPEGQLVSVYMVHKTLKSGQHLYEIPLTRDLVENEALAIVDAWEAMYPEDDHEIETSAEEIMAARQGPTDAVVIGDTDYNQMCETLAMHQHNRWCEERTQAGWRYSNDLNHAARTHPMLRPWEQLPERYRKVDYNLPHKFMEMLAEHGYAVVKRTDLAKWIEK
jgi:hypothetical protein